MEDSINIKAYTTDDQMKHLVGIVRSVKAYAEQGDNKALLDIIIRAAYLYTGDYDQAMSTASALKLITQISNREPKP